MPEPKVEYEYTPPEDDSDFEIDDIDMGYIGWFKSAYGYFPPPLDVMVH